MSTHNHAAMESCFATLLTQIGEDPERSGLENTAYLSARAFQKLTSGYLSDPALSLKQSRFVIKQPYPGSIEIPEIAFMSLCEHTFLPFLGTVGILFEPRGFLVGAGTFEELVSVCSKRLQLQETLTLDLANIIFKVLEPKWVMVKMQARHCCMDGKELRTQITLGEKD